MIVLQMIDDSPVDKTDCRDNREEIKMSRGWKYSRIKKADNNEMKTPPI